jgi:hypothetical protein
MTLHILRAAVKHLEDAYAVAPDNLDACREFFTGPPTPDQLSIWFRNETDAILSTMQPEAAERLRLAIKGNWLLAILGQISSEWQQCLWKVRQ